MTLYRTTRKTLPASETEEPTISAIAAKYGNAVSNSRPPMLAPISAAEPTLPATPRSRGEVCLVSESRRHHKAAPPQTSATPAATISAYFRVGAGLGTSDKIRSPSPSAIRRPPLSVTAKAAAVNAAVERTRRDPNARYTAATINEGFK